LNPVRPFIVAAVLAGICLAGSTARGAAAADLAQGERPSEGMIEFPADGAIYTVAVDTGRVRRVGPGGWSATWSPDGRLAYIGGRSDLTQALVVMNADGRNRRIVARRAVFSDVSWSPDGQFIAFNRCRRGWVRCGLWVIRPDRSGARQITNRAVADPVWSPDSRSIVYSVRGLKIVDVETRRRRRLTRGDDDEPAWSPDGHAIAFVRSEPRRENFESHLHMIRPDGGGLRRLAPHFREATAPAWSPDGTRIAFAAHRAGVRFCGQRGAGAIFSVTVDTGRARRLSPFAFDWTDAAWAPDGSRLAARGLACSRGQSWLLYVLDDHGRAGLPAGRRDTGGPIAWRPLAALAVP
jgi:Tol biopolymer transport system component